jgi:hypothetical protein
VCVAKPAFDAYYRGDLLSVQYHGRYLMFDFMFYGSGVYFEGYARFRSKAVRMVIGPNRKRKEQAVYIKCT